ncbi:hypothetical protein QBC45DRAFT_405794 [Copromyces sp. CBS 386.78]|nr:hypothetical protein QBC45DRAFT_405794 [Copromyces sp. CBS 386.78]
MELGLSVVRCESTLFLFFFAVVLDPGLIGLYCSSKGIYQHRLWPQSVYHREQHETIKLPAFADLAHDFYVLYLLHLKPLLQTEVEIPEEQESIPISR